MMQDRHCDEYALRLSDAELSRLALEKRFVDLQIQVAQNVQELLRALLAVAGLVRAPGLVHLRADLQRRIQRGHRTLQDKADIASTNFAHLGFGERHQLAALEAHAAASFSAFEIKQAQDAERESAFARTAFTYQ